MISLASLPPEALTLEVLGLVNVDLETCDLSGLDEEAIRRRIAFLEESEQNMDDYESPPPSPDEGRATPDMTTKSPKKRARTRRFEAWFLADPRDTCKRCLVSNFECLRSSDPRKSASKRCAKHEKHCRTEEEPSKPRLESSLKFRAEGRGGALSKPRAGPSTTETAEGDALTQAVEQFSKELSRFRQEVLGEFSGFRQEVSGEFSRFRQEFSTIKALLVQVPRNQVAASDLSAGPNNPAERKALSSD